MTYGYSGSCCSDYKTSCQDETTVEAAYSSFPSALVNFWNSLDWTHGVYAGGGVLVTLMVVVTTGILMCRRRKDRGSSHHSNMVKRRHPHANNRLSLVFGGDQLRRGSDMDYMVMGGAGAADDDDDDEQIDFALARPSPRNPGSAFCLDNIIMDQPPQASNQSHLYCDVEGISPGPSPNLTTRPVIHPRQDCQSSEI